MHSCQLCSASIAIPPVAPRTHVVCIPCTEEVLVRFKIQHLPIESVDYQRGRFDYRFTYADQRPTRFADMVNKVLAERRQGKCPQCGGVHA
jgi:hypothetical protein